jgi:capsular polysaccharide biosynthesis protein
MQNDGDNRGVTFSVKIYGYLLALYPSRHRREFGPAMSQLFRDQCRDALREAGCWGLAGLWLGTLPDLAKSSMREQFAEWKKRSAFVRVFAVVFSCSFACAAIAAHILPRHYTSIAKANVHWEYENDPYFLATQYKIMESYAVLTNVIVRHRLDEKLARQNHEQRWSIDKTFDYLGHKISAHLPTPSGVIELSVQNADPKLAVEIANDISESYCEAKEQEYRDAKTNLFSINRRTAVLERAAIQARANADDASAAHARTNAELSLQELRDAEISLDRMRKTTAVPAEATAAIPIGSNLRIFFTWIAGGTMAALAAGGIGAWISLVKRRPA